jgi:hypothetical protein
MSVFLIATARITLGEVTCSLFEYFSEMVGEKTSFFETGHVRRVFYKKPIGIYNSVSPGLLKLRNVSSKRY